LFVKRTHENDAEAASVLDKHMGKRHMLQIVSVNNQLKTFLIRLFANTFIMQSLAIN